MAEAKASRQKRRYYHHLNELEQIFELLRTHPIIIILVGPAGSGKADMVREILKRLERDYRDWFSHGVNQLSYSAPSDLVEQLKKVDSGDFDVLYIIENVHELKPEFKQDIFSIIAGSRGPTFILTSENTEGFNLDELSIASRIIDFQHMSPDEARNYLVNNFPNLNNDQIDSLITISTRVDFLQFSGEYISRVNPDLNLFAGTMNDWFSLPTDFALVAQALAMLGESFSMPDVKAMLDSIGASESEFSNLMSQGILIQGDAGLRFENRIIYEYLLKLNELRRPISVDQSAKAINDTVKSDDALDFQSYADAFYDLIENSTPPLTIGIYGEWGTGKSFILNLIKKKIEAKKNKNLITVEFDAWTYNANEHLWIGLVQKVFDGIKKEKGPLRWIWITLRQNLNLNWLKIKDKILPYALLVCIVLVGIILGLNIFQDPELANILGVVLKSTFAGVIVSTIIQVVQSSDSEKIVELFRVEDFGYSKGLMMNIKDNIECMLKGLGDTKFIVLIDDLDRCKANRAVEVLEAIHLLLSFDQFIVFLAVDTRIITAMIEKSYGDILEEAGTNGHEYLEKIVQIPFHIPRTNRSRLMRYTNTLTEAAPDADSELFSPPAAARPRTGNIPSVNETTEETPLTESRVILPRQQPNPVTFSEDEQKAFRTFTQYGSRNPRRIKRQLNVYRLVRSLMAGVGVFSVTHSTQVILWLTLNEYWPNMSSRMLELCREADDSTDITDIYEKMRFDLVPSPKNFDYDYEALDELMDNVGSMLTVWDVKELNRYVGNFHPLVKPLINSK